MARTVSAEDVREPLVRWAMSHYDPAAHVPAVWPMPGNAGLSFGFDVVVDSPVERRWPLVVRLSPPGVRRHGNTDVLRQVPLLRALGENGVPVARVTWSSDDPAWFGTDAMVQERLEAWPLHLWDSGLSHPRAQEYGTAAFLDQAVTALAAIHRAPWREELAGWEPVRSLGSELRFWGGVLAKSDVPEWRENGALLERDLGAALPESTPQGVFHGDYQTNNVLFDADGSLVAVVDWEISGLGAQVIDLGWLTLFTDASCWDTSYVQGMQVIADPAELRLAYEAASGGPVACFAFFRALACFRFGAIAAFNVRLHRTGRRIDESYERIAPSVTTLFTRGRQLLNERTAA